MTDLVVSLKMDKCCRKTLEDLDKKKKAAKFKEGLLAETSLATLLADKPIDEVTKVLAAREEQSRSSAGLAEGRNEYITRSACELICKRHAGVHEAKEEMIQMRFWLTMASYIHSEAS